MNTELPNPLDDLINAHGQESLVPCQFLRAIQPILLKHFELSNQDEPIVRRHVPIQLFLSALQDAMRFIFTFGARHTDYAGNTDYHAYSVDFEITTYSMVTLEFQMVIRYEDLISMSQAFADILARYPAQKPFKFMLESYCRTVGIPVNDLLFSTAPGTSYVIDWDMIVVNHALDSIKIPYALEYGHGS